MPAHTPSGKAAPARASVVGDAFIDIIVPAYGVRGGETCHRKISIKCGGTANVAIQASKLGADVGFLGKVGDDLFGRHFRQNLAMNGVADLSFTDTYAPTGICVSILRSNGERSMIADRGANDLLTREEINVHRERISRSLAYFTGYSLRSNPTADAVLSTMAACSRSGEVWFNPGAPNTIRPFFRDHIRRFVDVLVLNLDEAAVLSGRRDPRGALEELKKSVRTVAITMGRDGCLVSGEGCECAYIPTKPLRVSNTTGAGDAFSAGFLVGRLRGMDVVGAAELGNEAAMAFLCNLPARGQQVQLAR